MVFCTRVRFTPSPAGEGWGRLGKAGDAGAEIARKTPVDSSLAQALAILGEFQTLMIPP